MELVLSRVRQTRRWGDGWTAHCPHPGHSDPAATLVINPDVEGKVRLRCNAGCHRDDVLAGMELTWREILPAHLREQLTVEELARDRKLPLEFLENLGLTDLPGKGVGIPYRDSRGLQVAIKCRTSLSDHEGSQWEKGKPRLAYGVERLAAANPRQLLVVEDEAVCWTLWYHRVNALGLQGARSVPETLLPEYLKGVRHLHVLPRDGVFGQEFIDAVRARVGSMGLETEVHTLHLRAREVNQLHIRCQGDPGTVQETLITACESARQGSQEPSGVPAEPHSAESTPLPDDEPSVIQWPDPLESPALTGLAGEIVYTLLPHTEADEAALLFDFLVTYGNAIGRGTTFRVGAAAHTTNLYAVLVGRSSKGRKGTAHGEVERIFRHFSEFYVQNHITTGLSSGEGIIFAVRDQLLKQEPVRDKGKLTGEYQSVIADHGVSDKRLLVIEAEFASVLRVMSREGNTLSPIIRSAWDSGNLRSMVKNSPYRATNAHLSVLAHITKEELLKCLDSTEYYNGFANRFLWLAVRRSKLLPEGGDLEWSILKSLAEQVSAAVTFGTEAGQPRRSEAARELWREVYPQLSAERAGPAGAATSRAEAQVVRLSLLYALLDCSHCIQVKHLQSALAAWRYCEASANWIFAQKRPDTLADHILEALRSAKNGLTRTELSQHFHGKKGSREISGALQHLAGQGLVRWERKSSGGRPRELWAAL